MDVRTGDGTSNGYLAVSRVALHRLKMNLDELIACLEENDMRPACRSEIEGIPDRNFDRHLFY